MRRLPRRCCAYKAACIVQGKMRLVGTNTAQGQDESELLRLAAAVEGSTRHPLADAVLLAANKANLQVMQNLCDMTEGFDGHSPSTVAGLSSACHCWEG